MNSLDFVRGISTIHNTHKNDCSKCPFSVPRTIHRWDTDIVPSCMTSPELIESFYQTIKEIIEGGITK